MLRKIQKNKTRYMRSLKKAAKKSRTRTAAYFRNQYYLTTATRDLKTAAARNEDIVIASLIVTAGLLFSYMKMAGEAMLLFFQTAYELSELTGMNMLVLGVVVLAIFSVIAGWLSAFLLNIISISIMDGATRKQYKSVRATIRKGLRYASRVTGAWIVYLATLMIPLITLAAPSILYVIAAPNPLIALEKLVPFLTVASISSTILLIMNYGMMPYVALFEPLPPLSQTLETSRQLVKTRGRLFILGIYGFFFAAMTTAYGVAYVLQNMLQIPKGITFIVLAGMVILYTHSLMVMLYRKRKLARK